MITIPLRILVVKPVVWRPWNKLGSDQAAQAQKAYNNENGPGQYIVAVASPPFVFHDDPATMGKAGRRGGFYHLCCHLKEITNPGYDGCAEVPVQDATL